MAPMQEEERKGPGVGAALMAFALFGLIAAGSVIVAQRSGTVRVVDPWSADSYRESDDGGTIEMTAVMQQVRRKSMAQAFRRAEMVTIAGNGTIDLTEARMAGERGKLEVVVLAGRATVKVPPQWAVVTEDSLTLGALDNNASRAQAEPSQILRLDAVILGGRLEVTH
jgi:hypothetical protein